MTEILLTLRNTPKNRAHIVLKLIRYADGSCVLRDTDGNALRIYNEPTDELIMERDAVRALNDIIEGRKPLREIKFTGHFPGCTDPMDLSTDHHCHVVRKILHNPKCKNTGDNNNMHVCTDTTHEPGCSVQHSPGPGPLHMCTNIDHPIMENSFGNSTAMHFDMPFPVGEVTWGSEGNASYRVPIPVRYDLIPPEFLHQLAQVYEEGANSYGDSKYVEKPLPYTVVLNHLMAHLMKYWMGDRSELHMAKVAWGAATIIVYDRLALNNDVFDGEINNDLTFYGKKVSDG